ncbi:MAG: hypothetical protein WDZ42_02010 [Candidatus Saccharimonadales bacterium]
MLEQKDIIVISLVAVFSFIASFFIASALITTPEDRAEQVLEVSEVSSDFPEVNRRIFNSDAINPTEEITLGEDSVTNPFDSTRD